MPDSTNPKNTAASTARPDDEGGLRAPPELRGWRKAWWWFDLIILVKLARLRFIAILVVIGVIITQWDLLTAYYDRWMRRSEETTQVAAKDVEYFCPMHPTIVRDNPKEKCPICFMPLSKRKKGGPAEPLPAGIVSRVQLSPYRVVLAGVQTWKVDYVPLTKEITAVGYIEFNEQGQRQVAARVDGRIEKLIANETGRMVAEGDPLASLYSPDLIVSVQNLLDAHRTGNQQLLEVTRTRLQRLGIDDKQIDDILAAASAETLLTIRSPISGHVITKYIREGQYVERGTPLYELADLSTVWIQAQVYEDDAAFLPESYEHGVPSPGLNGLEVTAKTRAYPGETFRGKLAFIYPHVDQGTRTVAVRFELENPDHKLRPGSTATITLNVAPKDVSALARLNDEESRGMLEQGRVLAVPEGAVIDTGSQMIVYRETSPGVYEGVSVSLGPAMIGTERQRYFPVLDGLKAGDRVVTTGSFLVDAETRLNPAAGSIYFGGSGGSQGSRSNVTTARPSTPEDPDAKIEAALAALPAEDRTQAEVQRFCAVLTENRLGSMGTPIKLLIDGHAVFICCSGCTKKAQANVAETLATVEKLTQSQRGE